MAAKDVARGKAFERWVAGRLGWRRRRSGETANGHDDNVDLDGALTPVSLECKTYAVLQLKTSWVEQARKNAHGRPWAIVQRPKGWRNPVVTIDFTFFVWLLKKAGLAFITNQKEPDDSCECSGGGDGADAEGG